MLQLTISTDYRQTNKNGAPVLILQVLNDVLTAQYLLPLLDPDKCKGAGLVAGADHAAVVLIPLRLTARRVGVVPPASRQQALTRSKFAK